MTTTLLTALEARLEELACYDASCAPPPVGTGGSKPGGAATDYRGHHQPSDEGPRAHNLLEGGIMPSDVYDKPQYYTGYSGVEIRETMRQLNAVRGNPDGELTIYRAVPKGVDTINPGDWVTLSKSYATNHSYDLEGPDTDGVVLSVKVPASAVRFALDDLMEYGYFPDRRDIAAEELSSVGIITFACHSKACAPPPIGTGGSLPSSGLPNGADVSGSRARALSLLEDVDGSLMSTAVRAAEVLRDGIADGTMTVRVRVDADLLDVILKDGRLLNQHESGSSNGAFDPSLRESVEADMFGMGITRGPIYGYLQRGDDMDSGFVAGYGEVAIVLTPEAAQLSTLTLGDSLQDTPPAPIGIAELGTLRGDDLGKALMASHGGWAWGDDIQDSIASIGRGDRRLRGMDYIESQIHGGVKINSDVAKFVLPGYLKDAAIVEQLRKIAPVEFTYTYNDILEVAYSFEDELVTLYSETEEMACYDKSCAPPPVGTGGSKPGGRGGVTAAMNEHIAARRTRMERRYGSKMDPKVREWWRESARETARELQQQFEDGRATIRMRIPEELAEKILIEDREVRSQHDTGMSRGYFSPSVRLDRENALFGEGRDSHPVYGYVHSEGEYSGFVGHYGSVSIVLKPEAAERSTMVFGDSLNGRRQTPLTITELRTKDVGELESAILSASAEQYFVDGGDGYAPRSSLSNRNWIGYLEAQVHGGVRSTDIARIVVPKSSSIGHYDTLARKLEQAGYEVERYEISTGSGWTEYGLETEDLACYDKSCAPPPVGTGGSKPGPGGPSKGVLSPTANGRVKPDPSFTSVRKMIQHYGGTEKALSDALAEIYGGDLGNGYRVHVDRVSVGGDMIAISGRILPENGGSIGSFSRSLKFEDGEIVAEHGILSIREGHRGQGTAQRFNDRLVKYYNEIGVDRIELEAALSYGPFAWARQGYRFDGNSHLSSNTDTARRLWVADRINRIRREIAKLGMDDSEAVRSFDRQLRDLMNASNQGEDVQPIHIAALGENIPELRTRNGTSWPGKDALISVDADNESLYRGWNGVYYLGRESRLGG